MNQELRQRFAALHRPGNPVLLYNIWDVGSAKAVAAGGAQALATGSHSLAEANGYPDGEGIPFNLFLDCIRRIAGAVEVPVSADFEGGFAADPAHLAEHARLLAEAGAVGCNFKDAGSECFFVPGMSDAELIAETCEGSPLPVNVMMRGGMPELSVLAEAGVARVSWGPGPWRAAMNRLTEEARALYTKL